MAHMAQMPMKTDRSPAARLIVGNCVDEMREWDEGCVDLAVTSPPYDGLRIYNGYEFDFHGIAEQLYRVVKDGGVVVWVVGDRIDGARGGRSLTSFRQGIHFQDIGFNMHDVMIYRKKNTPFMRSNAYTNAYEFMFVLSKGKPATFNPLKIPTKRSGVEMLTHNKLPDGVNKKIKGRLNEEKTRTNIWEYAVGSGGTTNDKVAFQHPAVFPEKLALDHILSWSAPGDLVLDPMCGSGTTGKMALLNDRRFVGIDTSQDYIDIARQRLERHGLDVAVAAANAPPPAPAADAAATAAAAANQTNLANQTDLRLTAANAAAPRNGATANELG